MKNYSSFTLIEVILAILVIGVLSFLFIPAQKDNNLILARNQLIEDMNMLILQASLDDVFVNNQDYYSNLWQINFNKKINKKKVIAYSIYANVGKTKTVNKKDKTITNPLNYKPLASSGYYGSFEDNKSTKEVYLDKVYKLDDLTLSNNCSKYSSMKLLFDSLGRVHINNNGLLASGICEISLFKQKEEVKICLDSKTSFIYSC